MFEKETDPPAARWLEERARDLAVVDARPEPIVQGRHLRSRGIETAEARRMLCLGFAGDVLDHCRITPLREHVEAAVSRRLAQASDGGQPS